MQRWKHHLLNVSIALNCLLVFLLIFESRVTLPAWLQVAGRMHPLLLHFPIVLLIACALITLLKPAANNNVTELLLAVTAFTAVLTAVLGLFLSKENGYDAEALQWHKWGGVVVSLFTLCWLGFSKHLRQKKVITIITSIVAIFLVVLTGHQGAGVTHGQNFLLAPITPEKKQAIVAEEEAVVFTDMVQPILKAKCMSCHNSNKAKGELVMETETLLLKGGKSGPLWDTLATDLGLLLTRVHLPIEAKKHMPPQGKPPLTEAEITILTEWIKKGSDFKIKVADLAVTDTLRKLANNIFATAAIATYDFDEAEPSVIKNLNTVNRVVTAEALGSPAVAVSFFNSNLFNESQLNELEKIKKQIVSLDLTKMPLTDAAIKTISQFENLRRLNLSFTGITGNTLQELKKLAYLKSLSLSGTKITAAQLQQLNSFPKLTTVYTWNTPVTETELQALQQRNKKINFQSGFRGDTVVLKLTTPTVLNEEAFATKPFPLKLKHYIKGAVIHYTTDGSEPDSIHAPVYSGSETISSNVLIKAKAYKPGWISSDITEVNFYKSTYLPDTLIHLMPPDSNYMDKAGKILVDRDKGDANYRSGKWVAFRKNRMECLLRFAQPLSVQSVTLSTLIDIGGYIMPAQKIEIWGGMDAAHLKRLTFLQPVQPTTDKPVYMKGFECKFNAVSLRCIKIIAIPVSKLPAWHRGKGDKGWVFVDEILVN
jgi:uncharacterized membrane protein